MRHRRSSTKASSCTRPITGTGNAPVYFSGAGDAVTKAKFEKGTAEQWLALQGLKKEELEFIGLKEFLEDK
ncbi:MAG: hypothetical protein IIC29_05760, partial [Chloroflexi bacterium]|nr:hypothetical protein [Chloroflexota bacterium]